MTAFSMELYLCSQNPNIKFINFKKKKQKGNKYSTCKRIKSWTYPNDIFILKPQACTLYRLPAFLSFLIAVTIVFREIRKSVIERSQPIYIYI